MMKLLIYRLIGALLAIGMFITAFLLASAILAVAAVAGLGVWVWVWWRTRNLPRRAVKPGRGAVIEGEFSVDDEERKPPEGLPQRRTDRRP